MENLFPNSIEHPPTIPVLCHDWRTVVAYLEGMDVTAEAEDRHELRGSAIARILADYGQMLAYCAFPPKSQCLDVYIWPPQVMVVPKNKTEDQPTSRVIFAEPSADLNGISYQVGRELYSYTNIDAQFLGWRFHAEMISLAMENRRKHPVSLVETAPLNNRGDGVDVTSRPYDRRN